MAIKPKELGSETWVAKIHEGCSKFFHVENAIFARKKNLSDVISKWWSISKKKGCVQRKQKQHDLKKKLRHFYFWQIYKWRNRSPPASGAGNATFPALGISVELPRSRRCLARVKFKVWKSTCCDGLGRWRDSLESMWQRFSQLCQRRFNQVLSYRCIFTYIWLIFIVNVGKYTPNYNISAI